MDIDQLKTVVEAIVDKSSGMEWWQMLLFFFATAVAAFFGSYLKEKARSTAIKEDIRTITEKVESVKLDIKNIDRVHEKKYELKYSACMKLLTIIDAELSRIMSKDNDGKPVSVDKQYTTIIEARQCHNELLITVDNDEIIRCFLEIMRGIAGNPIIALNKLRKLVRNELGFGDELYTDEVNTWLGVIKCKKPAGKQERGRKA